MATVGTVNPQDIELVAVNPHPPHNSDVVEKSVLFRRFRSRAGVYEQLADANKYVEELEALLTQNNIPLPEIKPASLVRAKPTSKGGLHGLGIMRDGNREEITKLTNTAAKFQRKFPIGITFRDLGFSTIVSEQKIETVGNAITKLICPGPKHRVDILKGLTGRILPRQLTLVLGPPGCGKSVFLKALSGRLHKSALHQEGNVTYNGENIDTTDKFLVPKVVDYIEQNDTHAATLTVEETVLYAWRSSSGGHHSYGSAKDEASAAVLNELDAINSKVHNILIALGLAGCKNTFVGDGMLKGISGGQKRRVTAAEMMVTPRTVKFMDSISNGLDAATTYDIVAATKIVCQQIGNLGVMALLQPPPEVFDLFDDVILMSEGQIIYHGPRSEIVAYFNTLGYYCPDGVDIADFLQEVPTAEGKRYLKDNADRHKSTHAFVAAWKASDLCQRLLYETEMIEAGKIKQLLDSLRGDVETGSSTASESSSGQPLVWPKDFNDAYASSLWFHFRLTLDRQITLTIRDSVFLKGRIGQRIVIGAVAGSLFSNISSTNIQSMNGFLFFSILFNALAAFPMMPIVYNQKKVYYKHVESNFYPSFVYVAAQSLVLLPLHVVETVIFGTIMYWSAGLSADDNGARFLTYLLINLVFSIANAQLFRFFACIFPDETTAAPAAGIVVVLQVLFSGFIQPKSQISYGWAWFYWINPVSWSLNAITINEFKSSTYNTLECLNPPDCTQTQRFGDLILEQYGLHTSPSWIWYSLGVLVGMFLLYFSLSLLALIYWRMDSIPTPPKFATEDDDAATDNLNAVDTVTTPGKYAVASTFDAQTNEQHDLHSEPVTLAFRDIWYTVTLKGGEELDLLRGVSGYFKPGTVTALMGSSGAGKTTLLDVLSGRKNTGKISGDIFINGKRKEEHSFRAMMGYVEQFETLSPHDTARESVEFSAALRLPLSTSVEARSRWVDEILDMLELRKLENTMIGWTDNGGMTFEQKKRLSIGVELAANPAILFLDEPTTGLDSRAAQIVMRSIRRVAGTNRTVVCTIHQPSIPIFKEFDSLLLLKRGGQTVFFGPLGPRGSQEQQASAACNDGSGLSPAHAPFEYLIHHFEAAPEVHPIESHQNPATWMLEVIGAGTSLSATNVLDFYAYYSSSPLNTENSRDIDELCHDDDEDDHKGVVIVGDQRCLPIIPVSRSKVFADCRLLHPIVVQKPSLWTQLTLLTRRIFVSYWRTPAYNLVRFFINIIIALVFASAYAFQKYSTPVGAVSRSAVIYVTCLFCGVVGMQTVLPVTFAERPAFYREQQSEMYSIALFALTTTLVEIPYLVLSSLSFTLPFFFIVGFDNSGNTTVKFFWYWLFQGLYMAVLVYLGQFFAAVMPTPASGNVAMGITSTLISLFCGFLTKPSDFASFWLFLYWLNPLHYALEGLNMTQFHGDTTPISLYPLPVTVTAEEFITEFYPDWSYNHVGNDIVALFLFIFFLRVGTFFALTYLRHEKR